MTELPPFIQRLIEEKDQLFDRVTKLHAFTGTDGFKRLDVTDQYVLHEQLNHMNIYLSILVRRLDKLLGDMPSVAGQESEVDIDPDYPDSQP